MKLHYFNGKSPLRALVLQRDGRRIELHVKPVGEDTWALVALSGPDNGQPEWHKCQGPYRSASQAESALRGVAGSLLAKSYDPAPSLHVVWTVSAQRHARTIRRDRDASEGHYIFDPEQHEPLW
ncbi:MAG: hypothetical protein CL581_07195 [Alteromonadaceae bacterium]|uniref:PA4575 family protein n=1 Tax=unclassified Marinobacter TaxID=83889 RepID=UPI000C3D584B|nr:hypothetical protein [Marinobacter sp. BGYM27]MAA64545.1 hypothetical protein [Alteromonadaceae bacterium]MBH84765.1 hypothetical protein [Alteromonadaceae bacterium]MDG5501503.1 hypothetical protein [Marinobacter sp. BGYM27]|tara:strand:- start:79401 stop:79772 length:372 start_codon:yes stop_codon:yes gene_type:complete